MGNQASSGGVRRQRRSRTESFPGVGMGDFGRAPGFLLHIGRGAFGRVMALEHKATRTVYAIKSIGKARLITKDQVGNAMNEPVFAVCC